ncbi:Piso0_000534 [Millerozyma farinosa CBS 7064]|uniref:histidine kinase n=1 Tax=Pichia sorbitophila (strain ATCC MYA-4447 / BCRC 22081 / CBS 7064 / NBRC 10061 / NRRL Y-12695) TaxID=559304 RepID=G8YVP6_PICSO|nr:Piso0_000534 [Millerozyma farinosa CBS 7064]CCE73490.1 Piso0_000534 [Millerozyma farinosa CBS 7064]
MKRLKIGITPQLIILVGFSSLFSLLILAIVTGVYYSHNLSQSGAEKLQVIAQLKTVQVKQAVDYTYYQLYWLSTKDSITSPLSSYRAGNNLQDIFVSSQKALDQFLTSSELFASARLYNLELNVVAEGYNNETRINNSTMQDLYPLDSSNLNRSSLNIASNGALFTGPYGNNSDLDATYFMGVTLPVYSNTSIIISKPFVSGYLTVITSCRSLEGVLNDTSVSTGSNTYDNNVIIIKPVYDSDYKNTSLANLVGYQAVFPSIKDSLDTNETYSIDSSSSVEQAIRHSSGASTDVKSSRGKSVANGFDRFDLDAYTSWYIIVEQDRSVFLTPFKKFRSIIIGVVIGIGVFMCLVTFPLAVLFTSPITKLKEATESITKSKKKKHMDTNDQTFKDGDASFDSHGGVVVSEKKISMNSSSSKNSMASNGIRLPSRITASKKFFKDELTELSDAFNIMIEELDKQYSNLEDRVKLRTKELEASKIEAEAANEAKTVFIANISHELRTPLNGILGMTAIGMHERDNKRIQDSLRLIYRSGELLLHILTELLTYSKNTLNRSKLEESDFQILDVVYQVQSIFSKLAIDQRVNLIITLKPNVIRKLILFGDSNRIIQVVMNLVSNSLKFTPVDGTVDVTFKLLGIYDEELSKKDDYKKVYVKQMKKETKDSPHLSNYESNLQNESPDGLLSSKETVKTKNLPNTSGSSSENPTNDITFDHLNDSCSVSTLSTTEYENTIFNSQFKSIREVSNPNSLNADQTDVYSNSNNSYKDFHTAEELPEANDLKKKSSGNSVDGNSEKRNFKNVSKTEPLENKRDSIVSFGSSKSKNEITKNDKVYKIRRLYQPRKWAIQIEVTDTGPGIEPDLQEKVFDPFTQGDQTLSRSYGGTGLGLSICRQLATMMKGTLTLKSAIGEGSTFTLTIPLLQSGEIEVKDENMVSFCDDIFNPNAASNKKVTFNEDILEVGSKPHNSNFSKPPSYPGKSTTYSHPLPIPNQEEDKRSEAVKENTPTEGKLNETSDTPNVAADGTLVNSTPKNTASTSENPGSKTYLGKPSLLATSSTGTANSIVSEINGAQSKAFKGQFHLKILIAEDNLVNQEVVGRMLNLEGFDSIRMACNGAEAVDFVKESMEESEPYDLIFMDIQMPKVDGLLASKMIRNDLQFKNPIIALTAFADESNFKECLNAGMSGFLAKPIRRTNLRKIIIEFCPQYRDEIVTIPETQKNEDKN